jgi:hypothetical protein
MPGKLIPHETLLVVKSGGNGGITYLLVTLKLLAPVSCLPIDVPK